MSGVQQTAAEEKTFFGHPRGLMTLFTTELWERFSYYGMRAILLLYLTDQAHGLGLGQSLGEAVVSIYGASVYLLSVLGGWFADRVFGARRTVLYGGTVIVSGHLCLAIPVEGLAYVGIALVALGTGLLKPNVSTMVGNLYEKDDTRRDSAFSIFYMGINIGSFSAPFVVGFLRREFGFHVAFAAAAVGMTLALVAYVLGRRTLHGRGDTPPNPLTAEDRPTMVKITVAVLAVLAIVFALSAWNSGGVGEAGRRRDLLPVLPGADRVLHHAAAQSAGDDRGTPPGPRVHPALHRRDAVLHGLRAGRHHADHVRCGPDRTRGARHLDHAGVLPVGEPVQHHRAGAGVRGDLDQARSARSEHRAEVRHRSAVRRALLRGDGAGVFDGR